MTEIKNKPVWWPENPYKTDMDWNRKSDIEKFWDEGAEDCWDAYCEQLKNEKGS